MSNCWKFKKLGELLLRPLAYGVLKPGPYTVDGIPMIKIQDHQNGRIQFNDLHKIPLSLHREFKRTELYGGEIVISVVGSIGRTAIIPDDLKGTNVSRAFAVIGCKKEIDTFFLNHYLSSQKVQAWLKEQCQGNAQQVLNLGTLKGLEVPIPPLPEQKKIAEMLSGIDNLITKKQDLNKKNNLLLQAFLDELMEGDENWETVFLSKILLFKNGLNTSKENFGVGTPFVSYKNVYAGGLIKEEDLTECVSLTPSEEDRFCLKRGDILFTRTSETPDEIGFNAVYNTSVPAVFNGFCIRGRPLNDSLLIPEFSSFYFRSNAVLSQMRSLSKYTTRAGISAESLGKVQILIPPINVQEKIAKSLSSIKQLIKSVDKSIYSLQHLKQSISQDLLSGRKRVLN